jgi:16S rRNA (guanine527-N7)-methyltransferase
VPDYLSAEEAGAALNVSRETLDRLKRYTEFLLKWQRAINLIGSSSARDIWRRHILDCGQLYPFLPVENQPIVDIGSGAGLPGLVLAILGAENVHLIESDSRKCVFLREAARHTKTNVRVIESRAEKVENLTAGVLTARAVAPLTDLIELSKFMIKPNSICLFLKGKSIESELVYLKKNWNMKLEVHPSKTSPDGAIVRMESVTRVDALGN